MPGFSPALTAGAHAPPASPVRALPRPHRGSGRPHGRTPGCEEPCRLCGHPAAARPDREIGGCAYEHVNLYFCMVGRENPTNCSSLPLVHPERAGTSPDPRAFPGTGATGSTPAPRSGPNPGLGSAAAARPPHPAQRPLQFLPLLLIPPAHMCLLCLK